MYYPDIETFGTGEGFLASMTLDAKATDNYRWYIQEKIDGSNLGMRIDVTDIGTKMVFSCKKKDITDESSDMFAKSIRVLRKLEHKLNPGYSYHGEAVRKCRHNIAEYDRIPRHYFICFDIYDRENKRYLAPNELRDECTRVDLECIKFLYENTDPNTNAVNVMTDLISQIERGHLESMFGGVPEGIVLKHHHFWRRGQFVATKRKLVTKKFKECHSARMTRRGMPTTDDFLKTLGRAFALPARFAKARQHLLEANVTIDRRRMMKELDMDFDKEYQDEIAVYLWQELGPIIKEAAKYRFDDWYDEV